VGTNAQHSFFQLLHQGSDIIPCDFLIAANAHHDLQHHHEALIANCFAQSQALMKGRNLEETKNHLLEKGVSQADIERIAPHATFPGNRPSTTILYKKLDPKTLGMLIATYEHKTFVEGAIWNINSFDQWGVELGKELASQLLPAVEKEPAPSELDGSTSGLIGQIKGFQKTIN
jgi:glucose-6-phosphate isomerase